MFSLVVDDFGVKYTDKRNTGCLIMTLQKKYLIKMNWIGDYYFGITLEWKYHKINSERNVQLSMPGYVKEALIEFNHHFIKQPFSLLSFRDTVYGRKVQYVDVIDNYIYKETNPPNTTDMWKISTLCLSNR